MTVKTPYQKRRARAHAEAGRIAETMVRDLAINQVDLNEIQAHGLHRLYKMLLDEDQEATADERRGSELTATQDAAWILGVAFGRLLAAPTGGAR